MTMIMIIIAVTVVIGVVEIATYSTYGKFLNDKENISWVEKILPNTVVNPYNDTIIADMSDEYYANYISTISIPAICSKYYIAGIGQIPRWSKMHKMIAKRYKELKSK